MTVQTLLFTLIISFAIVWFIALIILVYVYGRISVKDNQNEAFVFVKTGLHMNPPRKAKLVEKIGKGTSFIYKGKVIIIPRSYSEVYYKQRRVVFINATGRIIPCPFDTDTIPVKEDMESLIYELTASHIGADGMRALKGKGTPQIILVAVIAFILGAVGVIGFNYIGEEMQKRNVKTEQTQPPNTTKPTNNSGSVTIIEGE